MVKILTIIPIMRFMRVMTIMMIRITTMVVIRNLLMIVMLMQMNGHYCQDDESLIMNLSCRIWFSSWL